MNKTEQNAVSTQSSVITPLDNIQINTPASHSLISY